MDELTKILSDFIRFQQGQSRTQAQMQNDFMAQVRAANQQIPRQDAEFRMETLGQSMSEFEFAPESGATSAAWYGRYESLFSEDAVNLSEQAKTRLLLRKLSTRCHQLYVNSILPQTPAQKSFTDTVKLLKDILGRQESLFSTRYKCLQLNKSTVDDYTMHTLHKSTEHVKSSNSRN